VRPIEEVRGTNLLREPAPVRLSAPPVAPAIEGLALSSLSLEQRAGGPRWVIEATDGTSRTADPRTGVLLPPHSASDAVREVAARYAGTSTVKSVARTDPAHPPLDLRRPIASWRVELTDGTRFYVDAGSGGVLATRTRFWRFYDWMWGLHIMDLDSREDTHNPWVIGFGAAALLMSILALILLPLTIRRRRAKKAS